VALPAVLAVGSLAILAYEKIGDWWNTRAGIAPQPIPDVATVDQARGRVSYVAAGALVVAGVGVVYLAMRRR